MKKLFKYIPILFISIFFSSCLEQGLDELSTFDEPNITNMRFEYRWTKEASTYGKLQLVQLNTEVTIDTIENKVICKISVPAIKDSFTEEVRANVQLSNIVGYADLSTASVLKPIGESPVLGIIGDFTKPDIQYEVKAANGDVKVWSLIIEEFNK